MGTVYRLVLKALYTTLLGLACMLTCRDVAVATTAKLKHQPPGSGSASHIRDHTGVLSTSKKETASAGVAVTTFTSDPEAAEDSVMKPHHNIFPKSAVTKIPGADKTGQTLYRQNPAQTSGSAEWSNADNGSAKSAPMQSSWSRMNEHPSSWDSRTDICKGNIPVQIAGSEGFVHWRGDGSSTHCAWQIDVTSSGLGGLVLQFQHLSLQCGMKAADDDEVVVYQGLQPNPYVLRRVTGSLPISGLLLHSPHVLLTVVTHNHETDNPHVSEKLYSGFNMSYTAYSSELLPPLLPNRKDRYNCSLPYIVPEALRCDLVEQCVAGEDERNCSYQHSDCGHWIPYGKYCLKFVFPDIPLSPVAAKSQCRTQFGTPKGLAALQDAVGKQLAANVTSLAGYDDVMVGLEKAQPFYRQLRQLYRFLWRWTYVDAIEFEEPHLSLQGPSLNCITLRVTPRVYLNPVECSRIRQAGYVCMKRSEKQGKTSSSPIIAYPSVSSSIENKICSEGTFVHPAYSCHHLVSGKDLESQSDSRRDAKVRRFQCDNQRSVLYTLTCNGYNDCEDKSDESTCFLASYRFPPKRIFMCTETHEVVSEHGRCDGKVDCYDATDEWQCQGCSHGAVYFTELGCLPEYYKHVLHKYLPQSVKQKDCPDDEEPCDDEANDDFIHRNPSSTDQTRMKVVTLDGYGRAEVDYTDHDTCPETHFRCSPDLCIPTYLVNNFDRDCPFSFKDEDGWTSCPGHYKCHEVNICLHPDNVCDGIYQCPHRDDEIYCNFTCPTNCTCNGLEYTCTQLFDPQEHLFVRYLDLSHVSNPRLDTLGELLFLRFLNLSSCGLQKAYVPSLEMLRVLDLSLNSLMHIADISMDAFQLTYLNLSGNLLFKQLTADHMQSLLPITIQTTLLSLSLANTELEYISNEAFGYFFRLTNLDISDNQIKKLDKVMFQGLSHLNRLTADDQKLCCVYARQYPEVQLTCEAPVDELSSCSDLLRSSFLRVMLWLQALMAVVGNVGVFIYRVFLETKLTSSGYHVLVTNLCLADLLMGIYMIIIGAADARFRGQYLWEEGTWTGSIQCRVAGFLALLSSEVSAILICLITVDRFLVLRFPLKFSFHLTSRSALMVCAVIWSVGMLLGVIPLLPATEHWQFYSQTGICLPLPITRRQFPGQTYSFAIFIVLNFVLFMLIGVGQLSIYRAIRSTPAKQTTERRQQDMAIARRLFLIVFTDFCCWFPVGVMGLMATRGTPIPSEVNVWTAVFMLPLNSALNPFLYTLKTLLDRRQKQREEERIQQVLNRLHVEVYNWPDDKVTELLRYVQTAAWKRSQTPGASYSASCNAATDFPLTECPSPSDR